jgi:hypothetical protein
MRIQAGRFVDDQQMVVFEEQARQHGPMKSDLHQSRVPKEHGKRRRSAGNVAGPGRATPSSARRVDASALMSAATEGLSVAAT